MRPLSSQLTLIPDPPSVDLLALFESRNLRKSTIKRYLGPARAWIRYASERGIEPHDAPTPILVSWLDSRVRSANSPASCIQVSLAAIRLIQRAYLLEQGREGVPYSQHARPTLDAFVRERTLRRRVKRQSRALRLESLLHMVRRISAAIEPRRGVDTARAMALADRDRALLLAGWWGALRADDLARLRWHHVIPVDQGIELHLPDSKTGPATLALARRSRDSVTGPLLCPVTWLETLRSHGAHRGPVFGLENPRHVARRIGHLFWLHGFPSGYSSHALRAGFPTECASQGIPDLLVQQHGRWSSVQQHREYVRSGRLWLDTPTTRVILPGPEALEKVRP